jgi:error-prone DNA polymerase
MPLFEARVPLLACPAVLHDHVEQDTARRSSSATPALPPLPLYEEVVADYRTARLSLRAHPISFYRRQLDRLGITPARKLAELENDAPVRVAGLVLLRQRPSTAKGITFVTLEDETGTANLVVHQRTWDRFYRIARRAPAWIAHGHIQTTRENSYAAVIHVVVSRLEALADELRELDVKSRDFR